MSKCAPGTTNNYNSCYSLESLKKIAQAYNLMEPKKKIVISNDPNKLWNQLNIRLNKKCKNEWCWKDLDFISKLNDKEIKCYTFKPETPTDVLLSTSKITHILKQFERKYKTFKYLGTFPLTFQELGLLKFFNLSNFIKNSKCKLGVVFNTEPHHIKTGHWVSLFIEKKWKTLNIEYFDSYGTTNSTLANGHFVPKMSVPHAPMGHDDRRKRNLTGSVSVPNNKVVAPKDIHLRWMSVRSGTASPMPKEFQDLINIIKDQGKKLGLKVNLKINQKRHQISDTECGVYSIFFIVKRLQNVSFEQINSKKISDNKMRGYRKSIMI